MPLLAVFRLHGGLLAAMGLGGVGRASALVRGGQGPGVEGQAARDHKWGTKRCGSLRRWSKLGDGEGPSVASTACCVPVRVPV